MRGKTPSATQLDRLAGDPLPRAGDKPRGALDLVRAASRITVKIGSSLLVDAAKGGVRQAWLRALAEDIAELRGEGRKVVVVSSGAVALGRRRLSLKHSMRLALKQAAAAVGQPRLMQAWENACSAWGMESAQLLLTLDDTELRRRWLNARATIEVLLAQGALPIINENDTVATEELRYGDNDRLSARVAQMIRSDLLILLSDVDGVYTGDPAHDPSAVHVPRIGTITPEVEAWAAGASRTGIGSGRNAHTSSLPHGSLKASAARRSSWPAMQKVPCGASRRGAPGPRSSRPPELPQGPISNGLPVPWFRPEAS